MPSDDLGGAGNIKPYGSDAPVSKGHWRLYEQKGPKGPSAGEGKEWVRLLRPQIPSLP